MLTRKIYVYILKYDKVNNNNCVKYLDTVKGITRLHLCLRKSELLLFCFLTASDRGRALKGRDAARAGTEGRVCGWGELEWSNCGWGERQHRKIAQWNMHSNVKWGQMLTNIYQTSDKKVEIKEKNTKEKNCATIHRAMYNVLKVFDEYR